jgi:hypothetical protein
MKNARENIDEWESVEDKKHNFFFNLFPFLVGFYDYLRPTGIDQELRKM